MAVLTTDLAEGKYINHWLVTETAEQEIRLTEAPQTGTVNACIVTKPGKDYDVPGREAFAAERHSVIIPCPSGPAVAGAERTFGAHRRRLEAYLPFGDIHVTRGGFWFRPTLISAAACTMLISDAETEATFTLCAVGRAILWVNREEAVSVHGFGRNAESSASQTVRLKKGINLLDVYWEDIAEREADFRFRLECLSAAGLRQSFEMPGSDADLTTVFRFLDTVRFSRPAYTEGSVVLCSDAVAESGASPVSVTVCGGTEENRTAGKLWEKTLCPENLSSFVLEQADRMPVGYLGLRITASAGGIRVSRRIGVEVSPARLHHVPGESSLQVRKLAQLKAVADYGEENINRSVAILAAGGDRETAERLILRQVRDISLRKDCSDFHLVWFPYLWRRYRDAGMLKEETWEAIRDMILNFRYWSDEPGNDVMWFFSENHALMFHTCQLLCGELFPDAWFPTSGLDGRGMQRKAVRLLNAWFDRFFAEGCAEWCSAPYYPIDSLGLSNLYLQTENADIRGKARRALDTLSLWLARFSFHGYLCSTAGRTYEKELFGNYSNGTTGMNYVLFGNGNINQAGKGVNALCLSDYAPPEEAVKAAEVTEGEASLSQMTQGPAGFVSVYSWRTNHYMLSSAQNFRPGKPGVQEHPFQLNFDPVAQVLISYSGEYAPFGSGRPSYWAGNAVLPVVRQYRGFASVWYTKESDLPVPPSHLYLPADCMEEVICIRDRLFVRKGKGFAMILCDRPLVPTVRGPYKNREWRCRSACCNWIVRASDTDEFDSFATFVEKMSSSVYRREDDRQYLWHDPVYGPVTGTARGSLSVSEI